MDILIEVNGFIDVPSDVSPDTVTFDFIDWIEQNHWYFGGGFQGEEQITMGGTVYSLERDLTAEEVETALRCWFQKKGWKFDGLFRTIAGNYYINPDGSRGAHVLDEI